MQNIVEHAPRPSASERLLKKPEEQHDERAGADNMTPARGEDPIDPYKQPIYDPSKRGPNDPFTTPFNPGPDDPFSPSQPDEDDEDDDDDEEPVEIPIPD
jgi:hypothetical protein